MSTDTPTTTSQDSGDEQYESNYTPREKILHKMTGAAYQATFDNDYDLMVRLCRLVLEYEEGAVVPRPSDADTLADGADIVDADAVEVTTRTWDVKTLGEPIEYNRVEDAAMEAVVEEEATEDADTRTDDEETRTDDDNPRVSPEDIDLPQADTAIGGMLRALYRGHTSGVEWLTVAQIRDYAEDDIDTSHVSAYANDYDCIRSRNVDGQHANEYQIPSAIRMEVGQTMFGGDDGD
jgi:hypothetical protein